MSLSVSALPPDILAEIVSYLTPQQIGRVALVSRTFHAASSEELVWERCCRRMGYPATELERPPGTRSWKEVYQRRYEFLETPVPTRCVRKVKHHEGRAFAVALSPDEKYLVSASKDQTLVVMEMPGLEKVHVLKGHKDDVNGVAFSASGDLLISCSDDDTIRVWDTRTYTCIEKMGTVHDRFIIALARSRDGQYLATGSLDQTACLLRIRPHGGRCTVLAYCKPHSFSVYGLAFSPDATLLATGADTLRLFAVPSGDPVCVLDGVHTGIVRAVAFSPNGALLASVGEDGLVVVWDVAQRKPLHRFSLPDGETQWSVAWAPDSRLLVAGSESGQISVWNVAHGELVAMLEPDLGRVCSLLFTRDGRQLLAAHGFGDITMWEA